MSKQQQYARVMSLLLTSGDKQEKSADLFHFPEKRWSKRGCFVVNLWRVREANWNSQTLFSCQMWDRREAFF